MRLPARRSTARRAPRQAPAIRSSWSELPPRVKALAAVTMGSGLVALAAAAAGLAASWLAAQWATNLAWTFAGVCALCGTLAAAARLAPRSAIRRSWLLYAAASGCWIIGAVIRDVGGPGILNPLAAFWWIGFAVLGIVSFARRLPRLLLFGIFLLDALPVVLLIVAVVHFAEPPPAGIRTVDELLLNLYPAMFGLLAANAIQMLGIHRDLRRIPASVWLFTLGFCLMAVAALVWVPAALRTGAAQGHPTDILWTLGLIGLAWAGLERAYTPAGYLDLPLREQESGPHAMPPAAALLGLIVMLAVAGPADRLLIQAFVVAAAADLFCRLYLMRREDVHLLAELAQSRAAAEVAAERSQRSARRLRVLADVTSRLSSLRVDELMQAICDTAREVAGARFAAFGLTGGGRAEFDRLVVSGMGNGARAKMLEMPEGAALMRSLLRGGRPVRFGNLAERPEAAIFPPGHPGFDTFLGVPMPIGPGRQGALYLTGKPGGFDEEDETLVTLLVTNAGHAVGNAELYEESQAQQAKLAEQNEQLRALDQMKDEFIALVSHELRTPLTSIIGFLELLEDEEAGDLSEGQRRFVGVMHRNAQRLLHLVGDLLFLAGLQTGALAVEHGEVDLAALAAQRVAELQAKAESRQVAMSLVARPAPAVAGDELRLAQLVDNLLSNAIKFTPPGGQVIVTVGVKGERAALDVADTGIGIPAEDQQHIFERFFRTATATDQAIPGTGLGLTICKAIVDAHGGTIAVDSSPGAGTTVRVRLPLPRPPAAAGSGLAGQRARGVPVRAEEPGRGGR
ncbi:MAG: ATP-binding protein [Gemmatimonadota bacterium]